MDDAARIAGVSREGLARLERVRAILTPFVAHRVRGTLRERVESAWLALGGPACAKAASDLEDAETFFDQLDQLERAGELPDPTVLEEHLEELYAAPDVGEEARVQVMTIHKAKGLEFGTVIVPGLDRMPRVSDKPLFAWKARADGSILMAPIRPASQAKEAAYDYLRELEKAASRREMERLLYVAATRAAKRLHLLGYARLEPRKDGPAVRKPPVTSLLGKAWPAAEAAFDAAIPQFIGTPDVPSPPQVIHTKLRQLDTARLAVQVPDIARRPAEPAEEGERIEFSWVGETARHVGTIAHRWLQRIATEGLAGWDTARVAALAPRVERELVRLGVPPVEREDAKARVIAALQGAIADERGRWILGAYPDARCEYRFRVPGPGGVRLLVIDRMFTDQGRCWIVDYKTSFHEGGNLEGFLDEERERYREKMVRYVPAFGGVQGSLGLYFPVVKGWREWPA
jgi:ATP-dependent exoDNAse (exonuclease V) beta subunit